QVMQQIDPNFDERNAGFNRFSKFVTEAGNRGLLRVAKLDNGQFEVAAAEPGAAAPRKEGRPGRVPAPAPAKADVGADRENGKGRRSRGGRGRGRGRERETTPGGAAVTAPQAPSPSAPLALAAAFQLMSRALGELPAPVNGEALRARMAALHGKEDPLLDPDRFARLLRQANDAEIADVRKVDEKNFEITPHRALHSFSGPAATPPVVAAPATGNGGEAEPAAQAPGRSAALRFRRGSRSLARPPELPLVGVVH